MIRESIDSKVARFWLASTILSASVALSSVARAADFPPESHASDILVAVDIGSVVSGSLGPFAYASGMKTKTMPIYSDSSTFLSAAASGDATVIGDPGMPLGTGLELASGTLSASAFNSPGMTNAAASVEDLALELKLAGLSVITIGGANSDVTSTSTAAEPSKFVFTAAGSSSITNLTLNVLGDTIDLSAFANPAPNTVVPISGIVGLVVTLNKQVVNQGTYGINITTDAIDIDFTDLHLSGVPLSEAVSGDITIAETFAQVPEPSTWIEILMGVGLVGGVIRRRLAQA
jgi:hypothetical protein